MRREEEARGGPKETRSGTEKSMNTLLSLDCMAFKKRTELSTIVSLHKQASQRWNKHRFVCDEGMTGEKESKEGVRRK